MLIPTNIRLHFSNCSNYLHSLSEAEFYSVYVTRHPYAATEAINELEPKTSPSMGNRK